MRKTISVDLDGVVAQFVPPFVQVINKLFPEKALPANFQPNDWLFSEVLHEDELKQALKETFNIPYFWGTVAPYQSNLEALEKNVWDVRFNIYYVTARAETPGDSAIELTSRWLRNHFVKPYNAQVVLVKDAKDKLAIMRGLGIQASIDDYLPTVVACNELPNHDAYLLDRPWNRKDRPADLKVVSNLEEYFSEISK